MIDPRDQQIAELNALVAQLRARIAELEARLAQNSSNSNQPPSSDTPAERLARSKPKSSGRPRGGQKGHKGHRRELIPPEQVTRSKDLYPEQCGRCGRLLAPVEDPEPIIHQVVELPEIQPDVSEYRRHRQTCSCGHVTCAKLPVGVPAGMCGPRLIALIGLLTGAYHLSRRMGVAEHLVETSHATPLEVFLALSSADAVPPPELVAAHAAATANAAPRRLDAPIATVVASGFYDCDSTNWSGWHAGATAAYEDRQAVFNTTSGDILFSGVINGQYQRRFDACAGDNILDDMTVYIDRKSSGAQTYTNILFDDIHAHQRFYYTSLGGSYPDWRMRIQRPSSGTNKSYGAGGAWSSTGIILSP